MQKNSANTSVHLNEVRVFGEFLIVASKTPKPALVKESFAIQAYSRSILFRVSTRAHAAHGGHLFPERPIAAFIQRKRSGNLSTEKWCCQVRRISRSHTFGRGIVVSR